MKLGVGVSSCFSETDFFKTIAYCGITILVLQTNSQAFADQFDTLTYSASAGLTYDDNVFRLPPGFDPVLVTGQPTKSDLIKTESVGINIDKKYANQELLFKGNVSNNTFNTFSNLDYVSSNYSAAWNMTLTPKFIASIGDSQAQSLNSFTQIHVYTRNLTTVDSPHLNADWWFHSNWHLTFAATESTTKNSLSVLNNQSFTAQIVEGGVKYTPADGNSIALVSRVLKIAYINGSLDYSLLVDTKSTESQKELDLNWVLSGKSSLSGNLLYINHQYPTFYQRDFSGIEGGINYSYSYSDKTNLNISLNRTLSSWYDYASSYAATDTASIAPNWQISSKVNMHIAVSRSRVNYFEPIAPNFLTRFDEIQFESLGFDWTPQRSVTFSTSIQTAKQYSNYTAYEYGDKTVSLTAQLLF